MGAGFLSRPPVRRASVAVKYTGHYYLRSVVVVFHAIPTSPSRTMPIDSAEGRQISAQIVANVAQLPNPDFGIPSTPVSLQMELWPGNNLRVWGTAEEN